MDLPATIETKRLALRYPRLEDAESVYEEYAQDHEVCRYMTWKPHGDLATLEQWIGEVIDKNGLDHVTYVISLEGSEQRVIGMVDAHINGHKAMIGYVLAKPFWGMGLMTEAVQAFVKCLLSQNEIYRAWAVCDIENIGSARVMEKVGMSYEGILKKFIIHPNISSEPRDVKCYALTK